MNNNRKYPCPKCETGELFDEGGMFLAIIKCDNPKCDYEYIDACGCISGDIED